MFSIRRFLIRFTLISAFGMVSTLALAGCVSPGTTQPRLLEPGSRLHVFLQPLPQEIHRLTLNVARISARRADGTDIPFIESPIHLGGEHLVREQKKLQAAELPVGDYSGLVLELDSATLLGEEGRIDLLVAETPVFLEKAFKIAPRRDLTLFLALSGDRLVDNGYRFTPTFSLFKPPPPLLSLKGVVSNALDGTLTIFEKTSPKVVSVIAVGTLPRDLALNLDGRRLFVALEGEDAIAEIDLVTETVQGRVNLRPGDDPREIDLSADGSLLSVVNAGSRSLSLIDALSLFERERILFSTQPSSAFFNVSGDRLFVLQPFSSRISLIDANRLREIISLQLEEAPFRGEPSSDGSRLYLITENSPDLLIVDAHSLAIIDRRYVGYGALSLAVDRNNELIYVGLESGEVIVLDAQLGLPIDSLRLPAGAVHLVIDADENVLYAVLPDRRRLEKSDLISKHFSGGVDLGPGGYAATVIGEE